MKKKNNENKQTLNTDMITANNSRNVLKLDQQIKETIN